MSDGLIVGPRWPARAGTRPTDAFRLSQAYLAVFLAATIDVFNALDRGVSSRYMILAVPILVAVLLRVRSPSPLLRRMSGVDKALGLLWLFGMAGASYGSLVASSHTTIRPVFVPMTIAFLYLTVLDRPTEAEVARILRGILWIGAAYLALAAVVNTGLIPGLLQYRQYRNAQFASVAIGLAAALTLRRHKLVVVLVALEVVNFLAYPSATSVVVLIGMILTLFVTRPAASSLRAYMVAIVVAVVGLVLVMNLSSDVAFLSRYYNAVGKSPGTQGRLSAWSQGLDEFYASPLIGRAFVGGTVVQAWRPSSTIQIPYHNDYVLFLAQGGLVGFGLLIGWMIGLEFLLLRRYRGFLLAGMGAHAALLRVLLVGFNAFFVAAMFNPVLEGVSRSASVFGFYGIAMLLGSPPRRSPTASQPGSR